jgi:hypothetical protein
MLPMLAAFSATGDRPGSEEAVVEENLTAAETLNACTRLIPTEPLLLQGTMTVRKLRGIVLMQQPFKLLMAWGAQPPSAEVLLLDQKGTGLVERAMLTRPEGKPAQIQLFEGPEQKPVPEPSYAGRIRGTDMTWMDLTLDFLWWKDVRFDDQPRGKPQRTRLRYLDCGAAESDSGMCRRAYLGGSSVALSDAGGATRSARRCRAEDVGAACQKNGRPLDDSRYGD